jgi:hypothetical protein
MRVGVCVGVGVGVCVAVRIAVGVCVGVSVALGVAVDVEVDVAVGIGVLVRSVVYVAVALGVSAGGSVDTGAPTGLVVPVAEGLGEAVEADDESSTCALLNEETAYVAARSWPAPPDWRAKRPSRNDPGTRSTARAASASSVALAATRPHSAHCCPLRPPGQPDRSATGCETSTTAELNASSISPTLWYRSLGSLANARRITCSTGGGKMGLILVGKGTGSVMCLSATAVGEVPSKGTRPVVISKSIAPRE